jgi:predicted enzyme related to lactoylglutathione lyase
MVNAGICGEFMKSSRDVLIQTKKMESAVTFYEKVLGFKVIERSEQLIGFETGSFRFFIERGESYGPVFEFYVPDLEQAKKKLIENGCRVEAEDPKVPRCYMRDSFGLIFNLAEKKN